MPTGGHGGPPDDWKLSPLDRIKVGSHKALLDRETRQNTEHALTVLFGGSFTKQQRENMLNQMIARAPELDLVGLRGVSAGDDGRPTMSARQKQIIDGMVRRLPQDELGKRARLAYDHAIRQGLIRVKRCEPTRGGISRLSSVSG